MEKKLVKSVLTILIIIVVLIVVFVVRKKVIERKNEILESYDLLVGVVKHNIPFGAEYFSYGYNKNGSLEPINISYKPNISKYYKAIETDELITYFDYETCNKLYSDFGLLIPAIIGERQKPIFNKYYENYVYDSEEKRIFEAMINYIKYKNTDKYCDICNYIVTKSDYFLVTYENYQSVVYQYEKTNDIPKKLFEIPYELEYFEQNKSF